MAIKFPRRRPDGLEIVHPDDLNENLKEFVDEINGNIDSDNIKARSVDGKVDKRFLSDQCFNEVFQSNFSDVDDDSDTTVTEIKGFSCSNSTTGYIKEDDNGNKMPSVEFRAEADGWAIVDFSVAFVWEGNGARDHTEIGRILSMEEKYYYPFEDPYEGRYLRPQALNVKKPIGGWSAVSGGPNFPMWRTFVVRKNVIPATEVTTRYASSGFCHGSFPQGRWHPEPIDVHGVAFKVEVNGIDICTSGWLFNGNERHGIHLCGAIPIVAGKNTISSSVRAATVKSVKSSRIGLGAGLLSVDAGSPPGPFDGDHAAKFSGNIAIAGEDGLSPIPKRREAYTTVSAEYEKASDVSNTSNERLEYFTGIDCTITNSNLVVQYRKA